MLAASQAAAQDEAAEAEAPPALSADDTVTIGQLQQALATRDAVIIALEARLRRLEGALEAGALGVVGDAPLAGAPERVAAAGPDPAAPDPGEEPIDPDLVDRALERALLQTGALVLPKGIAAFKPTYTYRREERVAPTFFVAEDVVLSASDLVTVDTKEAALTIQLGLPLRTQLDLDVPVRVRDQTTTTTVAFAPISDETVTATGFGDLRVGLSREVIRERGVVPNLVASLSWDTDTGVSDEGLRLGTGFHEVSGFLTATRRLDPLVFVASGGYTHAFERGGIDPGERWALSLGTVLAASPETSLRLQLNQSFGEALRVGGRKLVGTAGPTSVLTAGASVSVGRTLIDVSTSVGLTEASPDYAVVVGVPIRTRLFK